MKVTPYRVPVFFMVAAFVSSVPLFSATRAALSTSPTGALTRYITLRLINAPWAVYSKLITWPDEPAWDCKWITTNYMLGASRKQDDEVIIPVTYVRLGLYCPDFDLTIQKTLVRVEYHLTMGGGVWKVSAPVPDYPDLGVKTLLRTLAVSENSSANSAARQHQFESLIQKVLAAQAGD